MGCLPDKAGQVIKSEHTHKNKGTVLKDRIIFAGTFQKYHTSTCIFAVVCKKMIRALKTVPKIASDFCEYNQKIQSFLEFTQKIQRK